MPNSRFSEKFIRIFGKPLFNNKKILRYHKNLAFNVQWRLEEVVKLLENPEESQLKNLKKLKKETTKKQPLFTQQDDQFAFGEDDICYFSLSQEQRDAVLKAEKRQQNQNILDKFNKFKQQATLNLPSIRTRSGFFSILQI